ncbi:MAG TPA: hypothetical protein VFK35_07710 [Candidatus Limnocylindrales bacterium]|nr:hypothetical protein [Candidatus Limnocylindrales bacterium]
MSPVVAVEPGMTTLTGTLLDADAAPLAGVHLVVTQEYAPDGGLAAVRAMTGTDGTFSVEVHAWGTSESPAALRIATPAGEELQRNGPDCSQTWSVALDSRHELALAETTPEPLTLTATTSLLGEVCGTTGEPGPGTGTGSGTDSGGGGPAITPPPTDALGAATGRPGDRLGGTLAIGFAIGLAGVLVFLTPRPGARARD